MSVNLEYKNPLQIRIADPQEAPSELLIHLDFAAEKPSPGRPGKQVGDILITKTASGNHEIIISLGEQKKCTSDTFRQAGGSLARWLKKSGAVTADIQHLEFDKFSIKDAFSSFCEGLLLGAFEFNRYKSKDNTTADVTVRVFCNDKSPLVAEIIQKATILTTAVNLEREWAHEPGSVINPVTLAEIAQALAQKFGLKCIILDEKVLAEMKAGGILAVGQGSKTPPQMIVLEYPGKNPQEKPIVLIGKAITFDTGGYSLKSTTNIQGMKYDKCGGLTVMAILQAAATLRLPIPLVGIIAAAENMISANSYRPDDIITTLSGKTIEIITTDAEGRLVLSDALTYAQKTYNPRAMIDLATLTGGVITALGRIRAGIMSNNAELTAKLMEAGEKTCEKLWQLPLDEEYLESIKSDEADLKNAGTPGEASTIIGGIFLKQFVDDQCPWAHIDIAGVADTPKETPLSPKGATGFGIRLLVDYLESLTS